MSQRNPIDTGTLCMLVVGVVIALWFIIDWKSVVPKDFGRTTEVRTR